jgi:hypothetical protein
LPSLDSDAPFDEVARHLFRHLHDPRALRKNRLVRRFFEDSAIGGVGIVRERAVLNRIHNLVREGADRCRDADLVEGKDDRAFREHAIIALQCIERRPIQEVAASLGISQPHCYRERAAICLRVARYIAEHHEAPALEYFPEIDEFRFLIDRAGHRAALGDVNGSLREYDDLVRSAPSAQQKIEALRGIVSVSVQFGNVARAESAHAQARTLWAEQLTTDSSVARDVARACIDLIEMDLASNGGDATRALRAAESAVLRLEPIQAKTSGHVNDLYLESVFDVGAGLANLGKLEAGYDFVSRAEGLSRDRRASPPLRSWVVVEACRLRNRLLTSSTHWRPSSQRLKSLAAAFDLAYTSGALIGSVAALVGITEHHAVSGRDVEALHAARSAVLLAKQHQSERVVAHTSMSVVLQLLQTRCWRDGVALLPSEAQQGAADGRYQDVISYCVAARAFRMRAFDDAWTLAQSQIERGDYYPALAVRMRLIAASAAHELQRSREARALIEQTVEAAEKQGYAPLLRDTYGAAAKITGNPRFRHQASELARLVSA